MKQWNIWCDDPYNGVISVNICLQRCRTCEGPVSPGYVAYRWSRPLYIARRRGSSRRDRVKGVTSCPQRSIGEWRGQPPWVRASRRGCLSGLGIGAYRTLARETRWIPVLRLSSPRSCRKHANRAYPHNSSCNTKVISCWKLSANWFPHSQVSRDTRKHPGCERRRDGIWQSSPCRRRLRRCA